MTKFGKYNADHSVAVEATECILCGAGVDYTNSVRYPVPNSLYFYRVAGSQHQRMTPELQKQWENEARSMDKVAPAPRVKEPKE